MGGGTSLDPARTIGHSSGTPHKLSILLSSASSSSFRNLQQNHLGQSGFSFPPFTQRLYLDFDQELGETSVSVNDWNSRDSGCFRTSNGTRNCAQGKDTETTVRGTQGENDRSTTSTDVAFKFYLLSSRWCVLRRFHTTCLAPVIPLAVDDSSSAFPSRSINRSFCARAPRCPCPRRRPTEGAAHLSPFRHWRLAHTGKRNSTSYPRVTGIRGNAHHHAI